MQQRTEPLRAYTPHWLNPATASLTQNLQHWSSSNCLTDIESITLKLQQLPHWHRIYNIVSKVFDASLINQPLWPITKYLVYHIAQSFALMPQLFRGVCKVSAQKRVRRLSHWTCIPALQPLSLEGDCVLNMEQPRRISLQNPLNFIVRVESFGCGKLVHVLTTSFWVILNACIVCQFVSEKTFSMI